MPPIAARVAERHLLSAVIPEPEGDLPFLNKQVELLNRLISRGEERRLGRTGDIRLQQMWFNGNQVWAKVLGTSDRYDTSITLRPHPGHQCSCPDWQQNGKRLGPCKHVLKLGETWLDAVIRKLESM